MPTPYDTSDAFFFDGRARPPHAVRRPEADDLLELIESGARSFVDGPRRCGKTTLAMNTVDEAKRPLLRVDLQSVSSHEGMIARVDLAVRDFLKKYPKAREKLFSRNEVESEIGAPTWLLDAKITGKRISSEEPERTTLDAKLGTLVDIARHVKGVVFVDEFQAVKDVGDRPGEVLGAFAAVSDPSYGEKPVPFIFAGSNRFGMHQIFSGVNSLFFQHTKNLPVGPVEAELILPFLADRLGIPMAPGVGEEAYRWTEGITGDLQRLFSVLKRTTAGMKKATLGDLERAKTNLVADLARYYGKSLRELDDDSLRLLDVIAKKDVRQVTDLNRHASEAGLKNGEMIGAVDTLSRAGLLHLPISEEVIQRPDPILFHYISGVPAWKHRSFSRSQNNEFPSLNDKPIWPSNPVRDHKSKSKEY